MKVPFFGKDRYYKENKENILKIVDKVYSSGKVVMGHEVEEFEKKISKYCGRKYAIAVGSCTDALYFSLLANKIKAGDEVLVTGYSFIASASPILRVGAKPVFVDINKDNYMMDFNDLENKITDKTKAIIAVHLFGDSLDMNSIESIIEKNKLTLIEDAAQSFGSIRDKRKVGTLGNCSCISFDPTKILGAQGNGGVILTDDNYINDYLSKVRYHGKNLDSGEFEMLGFNSRLSSLQSSILSYNLDNLEDWIIRHRSIANNYFDELKDIKEIQLPLLEENNRHVYHKFVVKAERRNELKKYLQNNGIQTMIHYNKSIPKNKMFDNFEYRNENLDNINLVKEKVLSLPIHPWLSGGEVAYIIKKIKEFYSSL